MAFRKAGNFEIFISFGSSGQVQQLFKEKRHRCAHADTDIAFKTGLSYRQKRNLFVILALVVTLALGEDFHWEIWSMCCVSRCFTFSFSLKDVSNRPGMYYQSHYLR